MKSFHLRFEDNDFEKIQKISSELGLSINNYLTKKFADFDLDSELKSTKKSSDFDKNSVEILNQIHRDLCDICDKLQELSIMNEDMILELDLNSNIDSDDVDYLMKCIKNLRRSVLESTEKICNKLDEIR